MHNYNVVYEKKRAALRSKRLESFVSKHLKLSVKVAEQLNTKSFVQQSKYKEDTPQLEETKQEESEVITTESGGAVARVTFAEEVDESYKRRKIEGAENPSVVEPE